MLKLKIRAPELILGALLTVALIALGMLYESSSYPKQYEQYEQTENGPAQVSSKSSTDERIADYTQALAWFTAVLAVATFGLLAATWFGVRSQIKDTRILQRAYLSVEGCGIEPLTAHGQSISEIGVVNVGNLPARNVKWFIAVDVDLSGQRIDFPIDETKFFGGTNVIPPGTTMLRSQYFSFDNDQLFTPPNKSIYVWGEVRYTDGFGEARNTKFCHRYPINQITFSPNPRYSGLSCIHGSSMRYHRYGNDAD